MRLYCEQCQYPKKTCICPHIRAVNTALNIVIIQHEKEVSHAKNTARLISLCIPTTQILLSNDIHAMQSLAKECLPQTSALIYPGDTSMPLERIALTKANQISTLVLIDGSWKQAFGIVKQNPWLAVLPTFHFTSAPTSNYAIRHTKIKNALSTLEATAYAISCIEDADVTGLYKAQSAFQRQWQSPISHRRQV